LPCSSGMAPGELGFAYHRPPMSSNPYQAPQALPPTAQPFAGGAASPPLFILAAVGAGLASAYWGTLALLLGVGAANGTTSPAQIILPFVLVALYAMRGYQIFNGNVAATRRILWLHGVGGVIAIVQMMSGGLLIVILYTIKVAIHVFGGATAFLAFRSATRR
jgi:hypothetical protein